MFKTTAEERARLRALIKDFAGAYALKIADTATADVLGGPIDPQLHQSTVDAARELNRYIAIL